MYSSAPDAKHVVMRLDVAVIARDIMEEGYFAGFADFAKLLENPMDRSHRYMRMSAAYRGTYLVGARMVLRSEQGPDNREPLGRHGDPTLTTSRDKVAKALNCVPFTRPPINQPKFSHKHNPGATINACATNRHPEAEAGRRLTDWMSSRLSRYLLLPATEH
jgi:hypothetical protein